MIPAARLNGTHTSKYLSYKLRFIPHTEIWLFVFSASSLHKENPNNPCMYVLVFANLISKEPELIAGPDIYLYKPSYVSCK